MEQAFQPGTTTASLSASGVSSNANLTGVGTAVRIYNAGSVVVFLAFGSTSAIVATTGGFPTAPGEIEIIGVPPEANWVACITASGTATVYLTPGEGT